MVLRVEGWWIEWSGEGEGVSGVVVDGGRDMVRVVEKVEGEGAWIGW